MDDVQPVPVSPSSRDRAPRPAPKRRYAAPRLTRHGPVPAMSAAADPVSARVSDD